MPRVHILTISPLIQAVTIILSGAESGGQYLKMLTDTIETGLQNVIQRPDFVQTSQNGNIIAQIVSSLEVRYTHHRK